jgi:hypothetical protein
MNNEDFQKVENRFIEHVENNSGSVLKNNEEQFSFSTIIQNETAAFQKCRGSLSFLQRGVLIDCKDSGPSGVLLEECATVIQSCVPTFYLQVIPKSVQKGIYRLFEFLPRNTVVQAAVKAGLVSVSSVKNILFAFAVFLVVMLICNFTIGKITMALIVASIAGIAALYAIKQISLNKPEVFKKLLSALGAEQKGKAFLDFTNSIATGITHNMPLVVIVEDCTMLDEVSEHVIKYLIRSGEMLSAGALLWITFRSRRQTDPVSLFDNVSFPVKRYTVFKELDLMMK